MSHGARGAQDGGGTFACRSDGRDSGRCVAPHRSAPRPRSGPEQARCARARQAIIRRSRGRDPAKDHDRRLAHAHSGGWNLGGRLPLSGEVRVDATGMDAFMAAARTRLGHEAAVFRERPGVRGRFRSRRMDTASAVSCRTGSAAGRRRDRTAKSAKRSITRAHRGRAHARAPESSGDA